MNAPDGYRFCQTIEVRFGDTDMMGHVNNAVYFTYMEQARIGYFDALMDFDWSQGEVSAILAEATCTYKRPLFYGDVVDVWVRVSRLGSKSFEREYQLVRQSDGGLVATGHTVTVAYNYREARTISLPDEWREKIIAYEPALDG